MKYLTGHRIFLLCIIVALIAFATQLVEIPPEARTYPMVFIIVSIVMGVVLLFRGRQPEAESFSQNVIIRTVIFAAWIFVYLLLMPKIGYILSSLLFLYVGEWLLNLKNKILFCVFPIVMTLVMYLLFTRILSVILPMGTWFGINF